MARARAQLIDPAGTRWSDEELLHWLSDGLRTVLAVRPSVMSTFGVVSLVAGTRQRIPTNGHMFLGATRNMGSDGATPGRAVRVVSREVLDGFSPDWHAATATAVAQNIVFDPDTLSGFFVYPPNTGTGKLEVIYAVSAPDLTQLSDVLPILDNYLTALTDYVLFRAHQKDSDYAAGQAVAQTYLSAFAQFVGAAAAGEAGKDANRELRPGSKDAPA